MHERERRSEERRGAYPVTKNYHWPFPARRQRYCHIWTGCSREAMMIMMMEKNRRQRRGEIKTRYRRATVRERCRGEANKNTTWSNLKRQERDKYKKIME
jgi:hypothetical protein